MWFTAWVALGLAACAVREAPVAAPMGREEDGARELQRSPLVAILVLLAACAYSPAEEPTFAPTVTPPAKQREDRVLDGGEECVQIKLEPHEVMVGIHAVYMVEDCWDPGQFTVSEIRVGKKSRPCMQSHVIVGIATKGSGQLSIRRARVLDAATQEPVGSVHLRAPKQRVEGVGFVNVSGFIEGTRDRVRFDMDEPDFAEGSKRSGPAFNSEGPFVLELGVLIDEVDVTVRSPEFVNYDGNAPGVAKWKRVR